jgi:hypothetical protein
MPAHAGPLELGDGEGLPLMRQRARRLGRGRHALGGAHLRHAGEPAVRGELQDARAHRLDRPITLTDEEASRGLTRRQVLAQFGIADADHATLDEMKSKAGRPACSEVRGRDVEVLDRSLSRPDRRQHRARAQEGRQAGLIAGVVAPRGETRRPFSRLSFLAGASQEAFRRQYPIEVSGKNLEAMPFAIDGSLSTSVSLLANIIPVDHRAQLTEALEPLLALHAGLHLRHGVQSCQRNRLIALHAGAILTSVHPVERRRQAAHALQHQFTRGEADFQALAGLHPVHLVGKGTRLPIRPGPFLNRRRAIQLAKSRDSHLQILIEPRSDVIHSRPPGITTWIQARSTRRRGQR